MNHRYNLRSKSSAQKPIQEETRPRCSRMAFVYAYICELLTQSVKLHHEPSIGVALAATLFFHAALKLAHHLSLPFSVKVILGLPLLIGPLTPVLFKSKITCTGVRQTLERCEVECVHVKSQLNKLFFALAGVDNTLEIHHLVARWERLTSFKLEVLHNDEWING